jgi:hypothetical protein
MPERKSGVRTGDPLDPGREKPTTNHPGKFAEVFVHFRANDSYL